MNDKGFKTSHLPEKLGEATSTLGTRVRKVAYAQGTGAFAACLLVSWLALFACDRIWDTPEVIRILLSGAGWMGAAAALWTWYQGGVLLPRSEIRLAKLVRDKFGGPGDRFLGVLELSRQPKEKARHSEALFEAAAKKVEEEISRLELSEAVDERSARKALSFCAGAALLAGITIFALPKIAHNAWVRWANPWADAPRLTLAELAEFPLETYCARGEPVVLRCILAEDSRRQPDEAILISSTGQKFTAGRNGLLYEFALPGQFDARDWELEVGDAHASLKVIPKERPRIERLDALVLLPTYLEYPPSNKPVEGARLAVPADATVTLEGFANRPLGTVDLRTGSSHFPVEVSKERFRAKLATVTEVMETHLHFTDEFGLSGAMPRQVTIQPIADEAPRVDFENLLSESAVLETETLPIRVIARDDYGVSEVELYLAVETADGQSHDPERLSRKEEESPAAKTLDLAFPFDPSFLGLKSGDVALLTAKALDRAPDRPHSISREIVLHVVGPEEHAEAVRRRMEEILAQVSEIAREEEGILLENVRLADEAFDELDERQSDRALDNLAESQRDNARDLREAADEGAEALREALRNPLFDEKTLKEWSETMRKMEEVASGEMAQAARNIEEARSNPSSAPPSLAKSEQAERDALEDLREILAQANEQLDNLEALTLAQRLRQVQKTENRLGEVLVSLLPNTIGQRSNALLENQLKTHNELENSQFEAHLETELLQGEISRFHERTGRENYGEVGKLMEEERAAEGLRDGSGLIRKNVSFAALDLLDHWAKRFEEWADMLDDDGGGGGGGDGGGGETKDLTAQLVALLRIREKQIAILDKTTLLTDHFTEDIRKERSGILGKDQRELMTDLTGVQVDMAIQELNPIFDDAHTAMASSADGLEETDLGKTTTLAQRKSRDTVSDIINLLIESCSSGSQSSAAADSQALQFLLRQLAGGKPGQGVGMTPGMTGGGSQQGGDTDQEHDATTGNTEGNAPGTRKTQQAGGTSGAPPPEFRRALENYFRQIEE